MTSSSKEFGIGGGIFSLLRALLIVFFSKFLFGRLPKVASGTLAIASARMRCGGSVVLVARSLAPLTVSLAIIFSAFGAWL